MNLQLVKIQKNSHPPLLPPPLQLSREEYQSNDCEVKTKQELFWIFEMTQLQLSSVGYHQSQPEQAKRLTKSTGKVGHFDNWSLLMSFMHPQQKSICDLNASLGDRWRISRVWCSVIKKEKSTNAGIKKCNSQFFQRTSESHLDPPSLSQFMNSFFIQLSYEGSLKVDKTTKPYFIPFDTVKNSKCF